MPPGSAQPDFFYDSFVLLVSLLVAVLLVSLPLRFLFLVIVGLFVLCRNLLCLFLLSVGILFPLLKKSLFMNFL